MRFPQANPRGNCFKRSRPERHWAVTELETALNFHWIALAFAIITSMAGQTLLKAGASAPSFVDQLFDFKTVIGLGLYGGSALLYIVALRKIPMSVALPTTAVSYIAAALIGHYGFAEPMSIAKVAGISLICLGVMVLTLG